MKRARKRFTLYAMAAMFALLTALMGVINAINFTMAASDADMLTERLSGERGRAEPTDDQRVGGAPDFGRVGPMGPNAPDMNASVRYFTYAFDRDGNATQEAYRITAVSEEEAQTWAASLRHGRTGWTHFTYRYRTYTDAQGITHVTVIDQGREMISVYRILLISFIGEIAVLAAAYLILRAVSRRLFRPLEEADRKQKQFIREIEKDFKVPLTVLNAEAELLERRHGASPNTESIRRQVRSMSDLVRDLRSLAVIEASDVSGSDVSLSAMITARAGEMNDRFAERGITLTLDVEDPVTVKGEAELLDRMVTELLDNLLKFTTQSANITLRRDSGHVLLIAENTASISDVGYCDEVFDRFTRLENADGVDGVGLGLAYVKDIVKAHNGRAHARVDQGKFIVSISI